MTAFRDNPAFPSEPAEVRADWARMRADPRPLRRPVVILAGWHAPPLRGGGVGARLSSVTSQDRSDFLSVAYPRATDIRTAVRISMARITQRWPRLDQPIDVVGISMGGLVARFAAACPDNGSPPLPIARLFTLATPHRGARLAQVAGIDRAARDMCPGSGFLQELDRACKPARYELLCYGQLRDWWVGATRTAPDGCSPFWLDTRTIPQHLFSHFLINSNPAVLRDIARRLRDEEPVARAPSPPPPCD